MGGLNDRGRVELRTILEASSFEERRRRIDEFKTEHDLSDPRQRRFVDQVLSEVPYSRQNLRNIVVGFAVILVPIAVVAWLLVKVLT